jgi:hypothetical protein
VNIVNSRNKLLETKIKDMDLKISLNVNDINIVNREIENEEMLNQRLIEAMYQYEQVLGYSRKENVTT